MRTIRSTLSCRRMCSLRIKNATGREATGQESVLRMVLNRDPVVRLIAVISGRRFCVVIYRLTTVHTHRVSFFIALITLGPQPLPCLAPSRVTHATPPNKSGPMKARGAMVFRVLSACTKRAPYRWRMRRPIQERILWLILFCVSLYYTFLLSAMDCRICSRLLSARPCR